MRRRFPDVMFWAPAGPFHPVFEFAASAVVSVCHDVVELEIVTCRVDGTRLAELFPGVRVLSGVRCWFQLGDVYHEKVISTKIVNPKA
jgi:hypothetical protein